VVIEGRKSPSGDSSVVFRVAGPWLELGKEGISVPVGRLGMMGMGSGAG
jgi:hypothetical protein